MSAQVNIQVRQLGRDGPRVPRIGLGCVPLGGGAYGLAASNEERLEFLDKAYETGSTFWDMADEYADAEDVVGMWLAANPDKRKDITVCTKFGIRSNRKEIATKSITIDSSPEYCRQALEKSLRRLGVSYVDIYYIHRLDGVTPIEKTMEALVELKNAGKIKHIGLSECSANSLRRAHAVHPVACVQLEYSLFCTVIETPEVGVLQAARELGIAVVAYSPLGSGILTGSLRTPEDFSKPGDLRGMVPKLSPANLSTNVAIVNKFTEIATAKGVTTSQLALAWLLAQGDDVFPIPGTTKVHRMEENMGSMAVTLTSEEEKTLRDLAKGVAGKRVQELLGHTFGDTPALE
ncbi:NADP-dependent oxidoreductase domain-containing protein [Stachybotrys elegans]|uniref:NADP-dependent oxidoreductase domain-containing protein n=1 Tax=Stachybotrys elegans TaxID=80388 RepID=A0A8K0SE84_9HYPO|nr:NADP-dependent oxidoreductase domain-containing protein [Stachybotrys elegans]